MEKIPELYKQYPFFDDGKISPSRFHVATVVKIMTVDEAKQHSVKTYDYYRAEYVFNTLYEVWKREVDEHKSEHVYPHDKENYWCYAPETDMFVVCAIPEYDESLIYFARHINGGWFSFETSSSWQSGRLDVECKQFKYYEETFPELYTEYKDLFKI